MQDDRLRVLLVDDHQIVREGVKALLQSGPLQDGRRLEVVGEAGDGAAATEICQRVRPDVAVIDVSLPGASGMEVASNLRKLPFPPAVVMLSMHVSAEHVRQARQAGAAAYVVKGSGVGELAQAIANVAKGGSGPFPECDSFDLTDREKEVLTAILRGSSNREIAEALGISVHTVNTHRVHLMEKLQVHDVATLTRKALELGLG
jgi:DNA-binding NarL/FixJ family response regulator